MASRSDLCGYWKQQRASPSRYVEHFIARTQVGKIDQALTEIREDLWTDPVIDCGSLAEYSQVFFPLLNTFVSHYYVLARKIEATTRPRCCGVAH
jgi:hypothetical protein